MAHEQRLHEINTLEWDELLVTNEPLKPAMTKEGNEVKILNEAKTTAELDSEWLDY